MVHKIFFDDIIGHVIRKPYCFIEKPSKIFFSEMAEPVITASIFEVEVLMMSLCNSATHQYTNATQNTPHTTAQNKSWRGTAISHSSFSCSSFPACETNFHILFDLIFPSRSSRELFSPCVFPYLSSLPDFFSPFSLLLVFLTSPSAVPFVMLHPDTFCILSLPQAVTMYIQKSIKRLMMKWRKM